MADISLLQEIDGGIDAAQNTTNRTATFTSNISAGSVLLVCFSTRDNNPGNFTISDDKSNTWVSIGSVYDASGRGCKAMYAVANAGSIGTMPVVTFSKGGTTCGVGCSIYELANVHADILDAVSVTANGLTTGPAQAALGSTTYTNDLIFAVLGVEQAAYVTATPSTNYTASISNTATGISLQHKTIKRSVTSAAAYTPGWTLSIIAHWNVVAFAFKGNTTAPTITGGTAAPVHQSTGNTLTGVNFEASQGTGGGVIGGQAQTETAWADTSITYTADRGVNLNGVAVNAVVTPNGGTPSNSYALTGFEPPAGYEYVTLTSVNSTADYRITAVADLAIGNQLEWDNALVTINPDGTYVADPSVTSFNVRVGVTTDGWGSLALQTVGSANDSDAAMNGRAMGLGLKLGRVVYA